MIFGIKLIWELEGGHGENRTLHNSHFNIELFFTFPELWPNDWRDQPRK
jgi:hypothetical protein